MNRTEDVVRYPMLEGERINPNHWHIPSAYELDAIRQHYEVPVAAWAATVDISTSMWYAARQGERELGTATLRRATDVAKTLCNEGRLPRERYE